jgi:hypothetical protein
VNKSDPTSASIDQRLAAVVGPEDWLFSALLDMVIAHCQTMTENKLDSFTSWPANETAMRLLAEAGFIEITSDLDGRLTADVLPAGGALTARIQAARRSSEIKALDGKP